MNLLMKSLRSLHLRFIVLLVASAFAWAVPSGSYAQEPTAEQEAKFIATFANATLTGRWCAIKDGQLGPEKPESYTIVSATKVSGDRWQINARLNYGGKVLELPIPAQVKWAGDTPVLILDNLSMGGARTYSARVLIYDNTYAGTWSGGDHGGLINGLITNPKN